mmetsp:Transcript_51099/g.100150  ORF Transcript_51099/g.100150 Transcript_51099/m.100150 type:complete len:213 (+) Transcript_51099:3059-3697(+)
MAVKSVAFHTAYGSIVCTKLVAGFTSSDRKTLGLEKHAIKRVRETVSNQVIRKRESPNTRLIKSSVRLVVVCSRNCAPVFGPVQRPRANCNIVMELVEHLVPILHIHVCAPYVVEYVAFHRRQMGTMNNDPTLLAELHSIVLKQASWTRFELVEMEAVLSQNTSLTALFNTGGLHTENRAFLGNGGVKSHSTLRFCHVGSAQAFLSWVCGDC